MQTVLRVFFVVEPHVMDAPLVPAASLTAPAAGSPVGTAGAGSLGEETTTFEYDAENNLRSVTDALGNVETNAFDRDRAHQRQNMCQRLGCWDHDCAS